MAIIINLGPRVPERLKKAPPQEEKRENSNNNQPEQL